MERGPHVSTATLRGARAVAILCAVLFFVPTVLSFVFPSAFLFEPHQLVYERMLGAALAAMAVALLLSMRDPVRNAGVYATVGLVAGTVDAAIIYSLIVDGGGDVAHWFTQVPLLGACAVLLVLTYTRLRRPHPVVVRIVIAAVVFLPLVLFAHDAAYRAFVK